MEFRHWHTHMKIFCICMCTYTHIYTDICIHTCMYIYICKSTLFSYVCTWLQYCSCIFRLIAREREREQRQKREKHVQFENAPPKMICYPQQPSAPASLVSLVSQDVDAIAAITGAVEVAVTVVLPQCCSGIQPPWHLLLGVSVSPSLASKPSVRDKASLISDH